MKELIKQIKKARFVFIAGNGGSASTAEHFTNDLFSKGIKAICLNSNVSIMTMIANDFGYEYVFGKQIDILANEEDLLITISCSGMSLNIFNTRERAAIKGMKTYQFETFGRGKQDYEVLEDKHLKFAHKIAQKL